MEKKMITSKDIRGSDEFNEFSREHEKAIKEYEESKGRFGKHIEYPAHPDRAVHDAANYERLRRQALGARMAPRWQAEIKRRESKKKESKKKKNYNFIAFVMFIVSLFIPIDFGFPLFVIAVIWILFIFINFVSKNIFKSNKA